MNNQLKQELKKIEIKLEQSKQKAIDNFMKKHFSKIQFKKVNKIFSRSIDESDSGYDIKINNKHIIIEIDEYNNVCADFKNKLTIEELQAIHKFLIEFLEKEDCYKFRTGTSFLIKYYKNFEPSLKFIKEMIKINHPIERNDGGLKNWLNEYVKNFAFLFALSEKKQKEIQNYKNKL